MWKRCYLYTHKVELLAKNIVLHSSLTCTSHFVSSNCKNYFFNYSLRKTVQQILLANIFRYMVCAYCYLLPSFPYFLLIIQSARDGDAISTEILIRNMHGNRQKKINMRDEDDVTPLHYAARYNHLSVVKVLVENGASMLQSCLFSCLYKITKCQVWLNW